MTLAWVIGNNSGIGKATEEYLADLGYDMFEHKVDVREPVSVGNACRELYDEIGDNEELRVVYSAGINDLEWIEDLSEHAIKEVFNVNTFGFMRVMQGLASQDLSNVRVVAITSDAAVRPMRTSMVYCASKAALDMAVRVSAREMASRGWRVNAVAPGMTDGTNMTHYVDKRVQELRGWSGLEMLEYEMQQAVVKRRCSTEEVAKMVATVLDGPDYLNGAIIPLNGGR